MLIANSMHYLATVKKRRPLEPPLSLAGEARLRPVLGRTTFNTASGQEHRVSAYPKGSGCLIHLYTNIVTGLDSKADREEITQDSVPKVRDWRIVEAQASLKLECIDEKLVTN
jgi:hypothetical protein